MNLICCHEGKLTSHPMITASLRPLHLSVGSSVVGSPLPICSSGAVVVGHLLDAAPAPVRTQVVVSGAEEPQPPAASRRRHQHGAGRVVAEAQRLDRTDRQRASP